MMDFPNGEPVVVIRGATVLDPYSGEPSNDLDWSNPTEHTVPSCAVAPATTDEPLDGSPRDAITERLTILGPFDMDIRAVDKVRVRGSVYTVQGVPARWSSPFSYGWQPGCSVTVERVIG